MATSAELQWTYQQVSGPEVSHFTVVAMYEGPCADEVPDVSSIVDREARVATVTGLEEFSQYNITITALTSVNGAIVSNGTTINTLTAGEVIETIYWLLLWWWLTPVNSAPMN